MKFGQFYTHLKRLRVLLANRRKEEADGRTGTADLILLRVHGLELQGIASGLGPNQGRVVVSTAHLPPPHRGGVRVV
jgi:hypothetical protein